MKAILGLLVILVTLKVIVTQDDESQFDNEQNMDESIPQDQPPQDQPNAYPDGDPNAMNNADQNYPPPPPNYPDQNYPPPPPNYPPQPPNYPPQPPNYPPQQPNYPPQNYPPPPPQNYPPPPPQNYPPPPPQNYPPPPTDEIRCNCGEIARKTVVKKDSPNKGREMYVCPRPQNDPERCNFFLWGDKPAGGGQNYGRSNQGAYGRPGGSNYQRKNDFKPRNQNYNRYPPAGGRPGGNQGNGPPQSPNEDIQCACGAPAKRFVVRKETPNKGREFYACPKMREDPERCNFFLWVS